MHRVLRQTGSFVLSTHHPTDDWRRLEGSYFATELNTDNWGAINQDVTSWRMPLTAIVGHFHGLVHIHPFFESAAGKNAVFGHWFNEMNVRIDAYKIEVLNVYDPPVELVAGEDCADGTGPAEIKLLRWNSDSEALLDGRFEPTVFDQDFVNVQFRQDREVFVFAYVGVNTDLATLPLPPMERFDSLVNVSPLIEFDPDEPPAIN